MTVASGCGEGEGGDARDACPADAYVDAYVDAHADARDDRPDANPPPLWSDLTVPVIHVGGGDALGPEEGDRFVPDGHGAGGGLIRVRSQGAIAIDGALAVPPVPAEIAVPQDGVPLTAAELVADVTRTGTLRVQGTLTASGTDAERVITSTEGDIVIEGRLRGGDVAAGRQSLVLRAPAGTVFVIGGIETGTSGGDGAATGRDAGDVEIHARSVVVAGELLAAGERGASAGGDGGAVALVATDGAVVLRQGAIVTAGGDGAARGGDGGALVVRGPDVWLDGAIHGCGGDVRAAGDASGGRGGDVRVNAGGSAHVGGALRLRGGAATTAGALATGGAAGTLALDAGDALRVGAVVDARGGFARAALGGAVRAGAGGAFVVGDDVAPSVVELRVPFEASGGSGFAVAGDAGAIELVATGDGIRLSAPITARGGAATGYAAAGGTGARVVFDVRSRRGDLDVTADGELVLDGGSATGTGEAGGGGDITMLTRDGDATIAGRLTARGGVAPDPGGRGGAGGILNLFTDKNHDGVGGNLLIDTTGLIDVSGGAGSRGGDARNNGGAGVARFPDDQHEIAVLLNSDGMHGSPEDGDLVNLGRIVARGGAAGGWGGDVMFHGRQPDSHRDPLPGELSLEGDGSGRAGQFAAE